MPRTKTAKSASTQPANLPEQPHERIYRPRREIFINNLIGGVAWGLGGLIGATVVVALLGVLIVQTQRIPLIGGVVEVIINSVMDAGPVQELQEK